MSEQVVREWLEELIGFCLRQAENPRASREYLAECGCRVSDAARVLALLDGLPAGKATTAAMEAARPVWLAVHEHERRTFGIRSAEGEP